MHHMSPTLQIGHQFHILKYEYTVVLKSNMPKSDTFLKFSRNSEKILTLNTNWTFKTKFCTKSKPFRSAVERSVFETL